MVALLLHWWWCWRWWWWLFNKDVDGEFDYVDADDDDDNDNDDGDDDDDDYDEYHYDDDDVDDNAIVPVVNFWTITLALLYWHSFSNTTQSITRYTTDIAWLNAPFVLDLLLSWTPNELVNIKTIYEL